MGTITVRLPEGVEADLDDYVEAADVDRETAVRRLLAERLTTWRVDRAAEDLESGEVTVTQATEAADRSVWEFADLIEERNVPWVDLEGLEDDVDAV